MLWICKFLKFNYRYHLKILTKILSSYFFLIQIDHACTYKQICCIIFIHSVIALNWMNLMIVYKMHLLDKYYLNMLWTVALQSRNCKGHLLFRQNILNAWILLLFSTFDRKASVGGLCAGALGQLIASPTDLIKVQLQMEGRRKLEGKPPRYGKIYRKREFFWKANFSIKC